MGERERRMGEREFLFLGFSFLSTGMRKGSDGKSWNQIFGSAFVFFFVYDFQWGCCGGFFWFLAEREGERNEDFLGFSV